jgi:hypothetical protein
VGAEPPISPSPTSGRRVTSTDGTPSGDGPSSGRSTASPGPKPWYRSPGKLLAIAVIAPSFAIWIYAFSGLARRDAPDLLDDPSFSLAAEETCARALADIGEMPDALDAVDGPDRSRQVIQTTERWEAMLDDLDEQVGGSTRDTEITTSWLADWRVLIQDRYRYANDVANDPAAQFFITDTGVNEPLERRITRFATTNSMLSCSAPTDLG